MPVGFVPVGIVEVGDNDTPTGRGMKEFAVFDINTDVPDLDTGFEENQIAREQVRFADLFSQLRITSYNVCYTKLLRGTATAPGGGSPSRSPRTGYDRHRAPVSATG